VVASPSVYQSNRLFGITAVSPTDIWAFWSYFAATGSGPPDDVAAALGRECLECRIQSESYEARLSFRPFVCRGPHRRRGTFGSSERRTKRRMMVRWRFTARMPRAPGRSEGGANFQMKAHAAVADASACRCWLQPTGRRTEVRRGTLKRAPR
jgi:hypothetical protein